MMDVRSCPKNVRTQVAKKNIGIGPSRLRDGDGEQRELWGLKNRTHNRKVPKKKRNTNFMKKY